MMADTIDKPAISPPRREPNGRRKRSRVEKIKQTEREVYQAEMVTVMSQPHRQGSDHPWCVSVLGRFCLTHKLKRELHDAAEEYAGIVRRWRSAKGVPTTLSLGGSDGGGPSDQTVRGWEEKLFGKLGNGGVEGALRKASVMHLLAVRHMVLDDADLPPEMTDTCVAGLLIVAHELGWNVGKHPFA